MNILIVDNKTKTLEKLINLLEHYGKVTVVDYSELFEFDIDKFNLIVLSGSSALSAVWDKHKLAPEIDIILNTNIPILGICFGCELLCVAYKSILCESNEELNDFRIINPIAEDNIFDDVQIPIVVKEFHKWSVIELGVDLVPLAKSQSGYEIIKHKIKTQYGFQFHPEIFTSQTDGNELIDSFIKKLKAAK